MFDVSISGLIGCLIHCLFGCKKAGVHFRCAFDGRLGILKGQLDMSALVHGVTAWFQSQELHQFEVGTNVTKVCVCVYIHRGDHYGARTLTDAIKLVGWPHR